MVWLFVCLTVRVCISFACQVPFVSDRILSVVIDSFSLCGNQRQGRISVVSCRENNFPADLIGVSVCLEPAKKTFAKENEAAQISSPLVPIIPYGSDIPLQTEEASSRGGTKHLHGRQLSMDDQLYRKAYNLTNGVAKVETNNGENRLTERKKQLATEIRQQKEQLAHTEADETHLDRG